MTTEHNQRQTVFMSKRMAATTKVCIRCCKNIPISQFYDSPSNRDGKRSDCKTYHKAGTQRRRKEGYNKIANQRERERRATDPDYLARCRLKCKKWYLGKIGTTLADYESALRSQEGRCAICDLPESENLHGVLYVDHDHETYSFRGLLCKACNSGLGHFRDSPDLLQKAIEYLRCAK